MEKGESLVDHSQPIFSAAILSDGNDQEKLLLISILASVLRSAKLYQR